MIKAKCFTGQIEYSFDKPMEKFLLGVRIFFARKVQNKFKIFREKNSTKVFLWAPKIPFR